MRRTRWTRNLIETYQKETKEELTKLGGSERIMNHCLTKIRQLEDDGSSTGFLKRYVYVMFALIEAGRTDSLSLKDVERLEKLASAILLAQGIDPGASRLSFLHRDLHLVLSTLYRKSGKVWKAAWEQQLSFHVSKKGTAEPNDLQWLSMAIRMLRLGRGSMAKRAFHKAAACARTDASALRARAGLIQLTRLTGETAEALALISDTLSWSKITPEIRLELDWETLCCEVRNEGSVESLVYRVRPKSSHFINSYLLDAFLWSRSSRSIRWIDKFPAPGGRRLRSKMKFKSFGEYFECVEAIQSLYDTGLPSIIRMQQASKIALLAPRALTVEKELLAWASLARWLSRIHYSSLGALALSEYENISNRLSAGKCNDALGVMQDLLQSSWYLEQHGETVPIIKAA